jgi:glycosyltransferase involved in cell wall biosynthesis
VTGRNLIKVSVSITTYNHVAYIGQCLDSVLKQATDFPFEIVVGDNCSTDGGTEIVRSYAARYPDLIIPVYHDHNTGIRHNWQDVLERCRGEYIAHLDGDDLMYPGKLQRQADYLDAHPEVAACFHNMRVVNGEGETLYYFTPGGPKPMIDLEGSVRLGTPYCHSSKMYRRSALPPEGLDPHLELLTDWLVHIENARHGYLGYIDEVMGEYRRHPAAFTMGDANAAERHLGDALYTVRRSQDFGVSPRTVGLAEARLYYSLALRHLIGNNVDRFRWAIGESVRGRPMLGVAHRLLYWGRWKPKLMRRAVMTYQKYVVAPRVRRRLHPGTSIAKPHQNLDRSINT